jgi:hypothetical protein
MLDRKQTLEMIIELDTDIERELAALSCFYEPWGGYVESYRIRRITSLRVHRQQLARDAAALWGATV